MCFCLFLYFHLASIYFYYTLSFSNLTIALDSQHWPGWRQGWDAATVVCINATPHKCTHAHIFSHTHWKVGDECVHSSKVASGCLLLCKIKWAPFPLTHSPTKPHCHLPSQPLNFPECQLFVPLFTTSLNVYAYLKVRSLHTSLICIFKQLFFFFLSSGSGATGSSSPTSRGRVDLSSCSRQKSWRRNGWTSLRWLCEFKTLLHPKITILSHCCPKPVRLCSVEHKRRNFVFLFSVQFQ